MLVEPRPVRSPRMGHRAAGRLPHLSLIFIQRAGTVPRRFRDPGLPPVREFASGVVTVDPRDPDSIAAGLNDALARREELGREGRAAASAYDWGRVARETAQVYREAAA